ncbi:MAG: hypothetical protein MRJ92_00755 [Nitrospira sp.]|nr:hypothetical protein [Nitrospira sp.]
MQPVSKDLDYFSCFGLPRRLLIDTNILETKFYELSRAFHPDFYQNKSDAEQTISLETQRCSTPRTARSETRFNALNTC